jgi:hypothetical protein
MKCKSKLGGQLHVAKTMRLTVKDGNRKYVNSKMIKKTKRGTDCTTPNSRKGKTDR